jgi:hypothetical protein
MDLSRRSFAESLAVAALASLLNVTPGSIQLTGWTRASSSRLTGNPGALARALTRAIQAQYGSRLSVKDLSTIAQQIQNGLERIEQLKTVKLANGDEPAFIFTASRTSGGSRD